MINPSWLLPNSHGRRDPIGATDVLYVTADDYRRTRWRRPLAPDAPAPRAAAPGPERPSPLCPTHPVTSLLIALLVCPRRSPAPSWCRSTRDHPAGRRLPILLLLPAGVHAGGGARPVGGHPCCRAPGGARNGRVANEPRQRHHLHDRRRPVHPGHRHRLRRLALAAGAGHDAPERMGAGRARPRHLYHVVPAWRGPVHRLYVHCRARPWCTAPARSASTPRATRSWPT